MAKALTLWGQRLPVREDGGLRGHLEGVVQDKFSFFQRFSQKVRQGYSGFRLLPVSVQLGF